MAKELTFWRADETQQIAESLIRSFHEHLAGESIVYVFRSKAATRNSREIWAKTRKVAGVNAWLACRESLDPTQPEAPTFFLIEIAHDIWLTLRGPQRIALIDHELSHIAPDLSLRGHDVEEFGAIVARHGSWTKSLEMFKEASKQEPLFDSSAQT